MFRGWQKKIAGILTALLVLAGTAQSVPAAVDPGAVFQLDSNGWSGWPQGEDVGAATGVVMEAETGTVLYAKGMDAQRYPASLTKIMTALLLVENCDMNAQITMTETGLADAYAGSSNVNPSLGEVFTAEECLQMILVKSANDVATQAGEYIGGSVQGFADMMNARARELGCANTNFCNASGLEDPNHYTSAHDLALMTREAIQYDKFRETFGALSVTIPATNTSGARQYATHIVMLDQASPYYYAGCIGGKTGFTDEAQNCLMACAERNGVTLIGVLMGETDGLQIWTDMARILDYGFSNFSKIDMTDGAGAVYGGKAMVPAGITAPDLEVAEISNDGQHVQLSYLYQGLTVGTALMTEEQYTVWKESPRETESPTPDPADSGAAEETSSAPESGQSAPVSGMLYLVVGILGALIVAGVILIFIGAHRPGKHKKHSRKR